MAIIPFMVYWQGLRREDTPQNAPERAAAFVGKFAVLNRADHMRLRRCAGGIVAFEMAQQLVAQGQEVALPC
jgi:hypothetical protein